MSECTTCDETRDYAALLDADEEVPDVDPRGDELTRWSGMIAPWEKPTGDRRTFARDSLEHRPLPLPLKWQRMDDGGHKSSVTVGTIEGVEYKDDGVYAWGILLDPDPDVMPRLAEDVAEARLLLQKKAVAPSVDLASMDAEARDPGGEYAASGQRPDIWVNAGEIGAATLVPIAAFSEVRAFDLDQIPVADYTALVASARAEVPVQRDWSDIPVAFVPWDPAAWLEAEAAGESMVASALYQGDEPLFPVGVYVGDELHLVPGAVADAIAVFAAYEDRLPFDAEVREVMKRTLVGLADRCELPAPPWVPVDAGALVAAAAPVAPPDEWFNTPEPAQLTPMTVTADGRVFGHVADWKTCHVGFPGKCKTAPRSSSAYAHAHTGYVVTGSGASVPVGRITVGGGHADMRYGARASIEHYDNASSCAAIGRFSDGRHGIWFSGAAVPEATEEMLAQLRRHPPSGDWRVIGGTQELILAHSVNAPGFNSPRYHMERGEVTALVAAGYVPAADDQDPAAAAAAVFARRAADKAAAVFKR